MNMVANSFITTMAIDLAKVLVKTADDHWSTFIDEDGAITLDSPTVIEQAIEELELPYPEQVYEVMATDTHIQLAILEMKDIIKDRMSEHKEWQAAIISPGAMLRYHGMSFADFK